MHRHDDHACPMFDRLSANLSFVNGKVDRRCYRVSSSRTLLRGSVGHICHPPMWARSPVGSFDRDQKSAARMLTTFPFRLLGSNGHDTHEMSVFDRTHF
jgi:hypothetical protein